MVARYLITSTEIGDRIQTELRSRRTCVGSFFCVRYDDLGRRTSLSRMNGTVTSYAYDAVSRLASLTQDLAGGAHDLNLTFSHNPGSQIASNTRSNDAYAWTGHGSGTTGSTANGLNQLATQGGASFGYDPRGNMTNDGLRTFGYTAENKLTTSGAAALAYDPLGRLYYTNRPELFQYEGDALITERDLVDPALVRRRYVFGPGVDEPLVWYEGAGTGDRRYLHADERGSIVAVSDQAGNAIAINRYDEYGKPQAGNVGRFQYTGQAWLPEIGLYYYKARMYDAKLGRFMQTDPIGYDDGMNPYVYPTDPVNLTDPSGLAKKPKATCTGTRISSGCGPGGIANGLSGFSSAGVGGQASAGPDGTAGGGTLVCVKYCNNPPSGVYDSTGAIVAYPAPVYEVIPSGTIPYLQIASGRKGERGYTGGAGRTNNPYKKMRPYDKEKNLVEEKDPQTGKKTIKKAPPGFPWDKFLKNFPPILIFPPELYTPCWISGKCEDEVV